LPAEIKKEHLAHGGAIAVASVLSMAFGMIESSQILALINTTGSATRVTLVGGSVMANRSPTSTGMNASE